MSNYFSMEAFDYDDIQLVPNKAIVKSRKECDTSVKFGNRTFKIPVVPANMESVIDEDLAVWLAQNGYYYVMHRFQPEKTRDLLKAFDLDPDNPQAVGNYSVGMRQKLGIIQAVMEDQNIILLDEPTRGIDKEGVDQFVNLMKNLRSENKTVIVASHDEIPGLVYDRRLRMKDGILLVEE